MKVIKLSDTTASELINYLQAGKVLAMPTETAYGLITDSINAQAVKKVYQIKGRDFKKSLPLICSSLGMVKRFFYVPKKLELLAREYWPGPLSIRLKIKDLRLKINGNSTAVVRVSSYRLLAKLARALGRPLTATSANGTGKGELYSAPEVFDQFKKSRFQPDIIVDGDKIIKRKPSTIIGLECGNIKVLRQGEIIISKPK